MDPSLRVQLLGDFLVLHGDSPVTAINTPRLQSLLAYLVLHRAAPQSRNHIAFLFWPDSSEVQAQSNLRNLVFHLRQALPDVDRFISAESRTLQWRADAPFTLDVADFSAALDVAARAAAAGDTEAAVSALRRAVECYRGDLLPACYDEWVIPERESLRDRFREAAASLAGLCEQQRDYAAAINYTRRLLRHDPLQEAPYRDLMRLYALAGDRAAALRVYHECASTLEHELGVEPAHATREAYQRLLEAGDTAAAQRPAPSEMAAAAPLVGRKHEWQQLQHVWRAAAQGSPRMALLSGEAGIGKTRLTEELLEWAGRQGIATASARCYAAEGQLAFAPVVSWLRARPLPALDRVWRTELSRLLPELLAHYPDLSPPEPITEPWQRHRLFEALALALLHSRPLLLFLDDLQWCDRDTLALVRFLLRYDRHAPLLVVGTLRIEEAGEDNPVHELLDDVQRDAQLTTLVLAPLSESDTAALGAELSRRALAENEAAVLYRETEGNPLFVVEILRAARRDGGAAERLRPGEAQLPPTVQSVISKRLRQLSPEARSLARLAAIVGREFTYSTLAAAGNRSEDSLVHALDELWHRRIIREQGPDAYDFSHDKLREVAYRELSHAQRRELHRRVAQALESLNAADLDPFSAQIAGHYQVAGQVERAVAYFARAAEAARRIYANQQAVRYFNTALALLQGEADAVGPNNGQAAALYESLGDVLTLMGDYEQARTAYRSALVPGGPEPEQSRLQRKVGGTLRSQGMYSEALGHYDAAETLLRLDPDSADADLWRAWLAIQFERVDVYYGLGAVAEMSAVMEKADPALARYGTTEQRIDWLRSKRRVLLRSGRYTMSDEELDYERQVLALAEQTGNSATLAVSRFGMGFTLLWRGELEEAEDHLRSGLELARQVGDPQLQMLSHTYLAVLYRRMGRVEDVRRHAGQALEMATHAHALTYAGAARANLAWLAWREGALPEMAEHAQAAITLWEGSAYPFRWLGYLPMVDAALAEGRLADAVEHARAMLDPIQARLPDPLTQAVEEAVAAWERRHEAEARDCLRQLVALARDMGYL
ncbi:MAG TPA: AAA family ATPase [Chloroflexia bacterium]|nr:AAA family ATPase [Chloroflexia bacterium]